MKLLIITQKVDYNDDVLGFMHGWIEEFARQCERVTVICLQEGKHNLPDNVKVLSLGKGKKIFIKNCYALCACLAGRQVMRYARRLKYLCNFYRYIWQEKKNYDAVFVHMNPEYAVLGGLFWRLWGKKVSLWYAHGYVPASLKIAEKLVNIIFTSTRSGCRINSSKIKVIGQGIDTEKLKSQKSNLAYRQAGVKSAGQLKIITVGRISPSKDYKTLILAAEVLKNKGIKLNVEIIGGPATESDKNYFTELHRLIADKNLKDEIKFLGPVANREIVGHLQTADLFVNMGQTGSLDKAVVEAMACELPILTCNEALAEVLGDYQTELMYPKKDFINLAAKIEHLCSLPIEQYRELGENLRKIVVSKHNLQNFVQKIINQI